MDDREVRMRIVEALLPIAARNDIMDGKRLKPKLELLERYVIGKVDKPVKKKVQSEKRVDLP